MKNNLSKYLKRVQAGDEVVITDRGRPVARLVPALASAPRTAQDAVLRLRASHLIRPGKGGKPQGTKHPIAWKPREKTLSNLLRQDRECFFCLGTSELVKLYVSDPEVSMQFGLRGYDSAHVAVALAPRYRPRARSES